jgi:DNA-3-methyladenine glycosylase I
MSTYCSFCEKRTSDDVHRIYHDTKYGFPQNDDNEIFGRLILEINQAGLSWETILKKEKNFFQAFEGYDVERIAGFGEEKIAQLLANPGIIRNKLKINAVIYNAAMVLEIKKEFGTFKNWLDENHPKPKEDWVRLFKKTFKFVGGEIVAEFLMSLGYLKGAHSEECAVYQEILKLEPKWLEL